VGQFPARFDTATDALFGASVLASRSNPSASKPY
jgi:hypothetical protein